MTDITVPGQGGVYVMREAALKEHVVNIAHRYGWLVFSLPVAQQRRPVKDASGFPDMVMARDGQVILIELKQESAGLSPHQKLWHGELGSFVHVIRPSDLYNNRLWELLQ